MINANMVKQFMTSSTSALQVGGWKADIALGLGVGIAGLESSKALREGYKPDAAGNVVLGGGAGAGALLLARRLPATFASAPRMTGIVGAVSGLALIAMVAAPSARADVLPTDPFYRWQKETGEVVLPGEEIRTSDGIAKADKPAIEDLTAAGATSSARQGSYAESPNFIVIAATGDGATKYEGNGPTAGSFSEAFTDKSTKASTHYVIDRDGNISMYVDPKQRANHTAGVGSNDGRPGWNSASIGINLVNDNTGTQEYTVKQLEAARQLTQSLGSEFKIPASHVLMHRHVQENKADPVGFPWREWADSLDDTDPLEGRVQLLQVEDPGANTSTTNNDVAAATKPGAGGTEYPDTPDDKLPAPTPDANPTAQPTSPATDAPTDPATEKATDKPTGKASDEAPKKPDKGADKPTDEATATETAAPTPAPSETAAAEPTPEPIETLNPEVPRGPSKPTAPPTATPEPSATTEAPTEPTPTETASGTADPAPAESEAAPAQPTEPPNGRSGFVDVIEKAFKPRYDAGVPVAESGEAKASAPKTGSLLSTVIGWFA